MTNINHNFIISMTTAQKRRNHIVQEFTKQNIPFQFFDALIPSQELNNAITSFFPNLEKSKMSEGEKACFMSHILLWKKCIDLNLSYINIFEDDIILGNESDLFLAHSNWIEERFKKDDFFLIHLETFLMSSKCDIQDKIMPYGNREFRILREVHYGAAGYCISNYAAKYLLNILLELKTEDIEPIDELIFNKYLNEDDFVVYQLYPALCVQELQYNKTYSELNSQLESERYSFRKLHEKPKVRRSFTERLYRLFTKPKRMIEKRRIAKEKIKNMIHFR